MPLASPDHLTSALSGRARVALRGKYAFTAQALDAADDLAEAKISSHEEMQCFDDLPAELRDAVAAHPEKVTAQSVLGRLLLLRREHGREAVTLILAELELLATCGEAGTEGQTVRMGTAPPR